jgi:hypothetical protein
MGNLSEAFDDWTKAKKAFVEANKGIVKNGAAVIEDNQLDELFSQLNIDGDELMEECNRMVQQVYLAFVQGVDVSIIVKGVLAEGLAVGITMERNRMEEI